MTTLKENDTRQKGDLTRCLDPRGSYDAGDKSELQPQAWRPVQLLGHPILASDLMHAEYRRP